jgi:murein DD-endopeptidase MepM/ murein hydrolase activator NlpD
MTIKRLSSVLTLALVLVIGVPGVFSAQPSATSTSQSLTREELEAQVQTKAKQLDEINRQLETTKQNLKGTTEQKLTLQKQLNALQGNINQLDLSIKSDQVTIQKLNLEVGALNYDIQDIQTSIADKKTAIEKLLLELQKNDRLEGNLLVVFLRNASLADGILEAQTLKNLQNQLAVDIVNLSNLSDEYNSKILEVGDKKGEISFHQQNLSNRKSIAEDQKTEQQQILKETKNKESVFQQQLTELEKQQQQIADEVEALDAILRTKIDPSLLPALRPGVLAMPAADVDKGDITQDYGATSFAQYGYRGKWHNGIDIGVPIGTPVLAADDGEVVATGNQDAYCYKGAYGRFIVIKHADNLTTLYAHLSKQVVAKGDIVKRGQLIGYSGKTGYATGPHLHFTVFAAPTFYMGPSHTCGPMPYGGDLNPIGYL